MNAHIARLDASLAKRGEDIVLRRIVGGVLKSVAIRAHVRSFNLNASDVVTGITKVPFTIITSMTMIRAANWPEGAVRADPPFDVDPAIPAIGDTLIIKGKVFTIKSSDPIAVNGEVVKVELMAEG